ncbi:hypothetical protein [Faecalibacillus intestinalis]|uniref:hypothetical protein n=1 Tax=Faecalibacillus intestinalis TaxID=1982626 RepID=UPI0013147F96|nr:hypothetical protein [Faecalibacillus intestinalis]MZK56769.1 hypothetical protein [Coprobacillus sp. BIOML-A1]
MVIKIYVLALKSSLHQQMPLAWKKEQFFYQQQLFLSNVQENTLRDDRNIIYFNT